MQDSISKGQGNSRYLKSVANFKALYPTYDDFVSALVAGTLPVDFNGKNAAGWQQMGTELSKANLMSDQSATLFNLSSANVPNDIFELIGNGLPIRNGGTGATTAARAFYNLVSALSTVSTAGSSYYIPMQYSSSGRRISYTNLISAIVTEVTGKFNFYDNETFCFAHGTYIGTGKYGSSNPMSITLPFYPKLMAVAFQNPMYTVIEDVSTWTSSYSASRGFSDSGRANTYGKKSGKTVYWYNTTNAGNQQNTTNEDFKWFAIGVLDAVSA